MGKRITITRADGELGTIDESELARAQESGFRVVDEQEAAAIEARREAQSTTGMVIGAGEAGLRGATLGLSDVALRSLGVDMEAARARQENLGTLGAGVELAGALAPTLLTGGSGAAGTLARLTPAGALSRAGTATAGAFGRRKLAGTVAQGAVEGFGGGIGMSASQQSLADQDLAAERTIAGGLDGLGIGVLLSGGLGVAGAGAAYGGRRLERAAEPGIAALGRAGTAARQVVGSTLATTGATLRQGLSGLQGGVTRPRLERFGQLQGRVLGAREPDVLARSWGRLADPTERARILADPDALRETTARTIKTSADRANAAVDEAIRLTQGDAKLRRVEKLMSDRVEPDDFVSPVREGQESVVTELEQANIIGPVAAEASETGMRNLDVHLKGYEGATPDQVRRIAAGEIPSMTGKAFDPVQIVDNGLDHADYDLPRFVIRDGRHRIAAAKEAGATRVLADVVFEDGTVSRGLVKIADDRVIPNKYNATANPRAIQFLREQQDQLRSAREALGESISPELARDMAKAQRLTQKAIDDAIKGKSGAAAFRSVDQLKRELDLLAEGRASQYARQAAPEIKEAVDVMRSFSRQARSHLEDATIYGEAATLQRNMNAAMSAEFRALEKLGTGNSSLRKMFKRGEEADAASALQLARSAGRLKGETKLSAVDEVLDARMEMLKTARDNYDLPPEAIQKIDDAQKAIEDMRSQLREQSATLSVLDDVEQLRKLEGGGSPSITTLSTVGPSVGGLVGLSMGGPIGAVVGSLAGSFTRPYTSLRFAAGAYDQLGALAKGVDAVAIRENAIVRRLEGLANGVKTKATAAAAATRRAVVRGARATARGVAAGGRAARRGVAYSATKDAVSQETAKQREDRLLDTRATILAAASDPLALADTMEDRVAAVRELAPSLANTIVERSSVAIQFLASKAPDVYEPEFGPRVRIVDPAALDRFERYVDAVTDPLGAAEKVVSGGLALEHAEALRVVYPRIFGELQQKTLDMLGRRKQEGTPTSEEALVELSILLEMPLTDSVRPGFLSSLGAPKAPQEQAAPTGPKPIEIKGQQTEMGRLESGELRA